MNTLVKTSDSDTHYLEAELRTLIAEDSSMWDFLQQGSLDGVWYWDLENPDDEWTSPEFWRLLGIDPATKAHNPAEWQDIIFKDDLTVALENFHKHCQDPAHPYDQIVRYLHADGSTIWVRCRGIAIRDASGRAIRMLGAHNDLTAVKRAEEEALREKAKLKLANEELTAFTYGVSHDLKSPSRTALQLVKEGLLCDDGALSEEQKDLFEGACRTLERMQILISDLLDYGILVDEQVTPEHVDLKALIDEVADDLQPDLDAAQATLHVGQLPNVFGQRSQLRMLLQNLMSNAVKYRREDVPPVIEITAQRNGNGDTTLRIRDNGCGIPADQQDKIFGVFTRLHRQDEVSGSGVGLAICKRVALNHDASIDVTPTPDEGSSFDIRFPAARCKDG